MTPVTPALPKSTARGTLAAPAADISSANYAFLQRFIHAQSGIVVEADKQYLLESRLLPVLRDHDLHSLDELSVRLKECGSTPLSRKVVEAMTTNETLFFRDQAVFEALRNHILPSLFDRVQGTRKLRIWSAAASTGQEAYSLAMMLLEMGKSRLDVEILGTDLSNQVLERAREGRYVQFEVNRGLPASLLMRYFSRKGLDWQLKDEVKSFVRFQQLDLRHDCRSLGSFDLVLCRNVLIYFDMETRKQILESARRLLLPGSVLVLGCSETVINLHDGYQRKVVGQSTFYTI